MREQSPKVANLPDGIDSVARSPCPITTTLDIVGDKWTLILMRDLLVGKSRYGEFLESPEGIPTNILADRLKKMELWGLIEKTPTDHPKRFTYALTDRGRGLHPTLREICRWGNAEFPGTWTPPESFMEE